jgi:hypothetical protein
MWPVFTLPSHLPPTHPAADFSMGGVPGDEFKTMIRHIIKFKGKRPSVEEVEAHASAAAKGMTVSANAALTFVDFVDNVEAAKLRGTSKLFRGDPVQYPACLASIREGMLGGGGAEGPGLVAGAGAGAGVGVGAGGGLVGFRDAVSPPPAERTPAEDRT